MTDNIYTILRKHPKLRVLLQNPYRHLVISNNDQTLYNLYFRTTGLIEVMWDRNYLTLEQVDEALTELEEIMEADDEIARGTSLCHPPLKSPIQPEDLF